jgi:hypothetical protein
MVLFGPLGCLSGGNYLAEYQKLLRDVNAEITVLD